METILFTFGAMMALMLLVAIAEPLRFLPEFEQRKKRVGSTYWGIYEGASIEDDATHTVELHKVARKERYIAGSSTYAQGKGVNMSGRK
jgi:hypothetical protein